jgi:predicted anti-sigma-YlaC factor YlaD
MQSDRHEIFQHQIDEALAMGTPVHENPSLREHLTSCAQCREYLDASNRVLASLGAFSFELNPAVQRQVSQSIALRAQQLQPAKFDTRRLASVWLVALLLTLAGSFLDLHLGSLFASLLNIKVPQMQAGLLAFWIVPSLCLLLLFPMLPLLSAAVTSRNERTI